jgi:tryptophanyl-tRNA synthetase
MLDEPDAIRKKFISAVTDSGREVVYDGEKKPGIANLLEILEVTTREPIAAIEARYADKGYGDFKREVGEAVVALLEPIRKRYQELRSDETEILRVLERGAERAREASAPVLQAMYGSMGFVRPSD